VGLRKSATWISNFGLSSSLGPYHVYWYGISGATGQTAQDEGPSHPPQRSRARVASAERPGDANSETRTALNSSHHHGNVRNDRQKHPFFFPQAENPNLLFFFPPWPQPKMPNLTYAISQVSQSKQGNDLQSIRKSREPETEAFLSHIITA
jgi:hypothetical protein